MDANSKERLSNKRAWQAGKGIGVKAAPQSDEANASMDKRIAESVAMIRSIKEGKK